MKFVDVSYEESMDQLHGQVDAKTGKTCNKIV